MRIRNVKVIQAELRARRQATTASIRRGLWKVGLYVQREAMMLTPVDTGNLRAGATTRMKQTRTGARVRVIYVAAYAVFVHENLHSRHEVGENKFLVKAVRRNLPQILRIFRAEFK